MEAEIKQINKLRKDRMKLEGDKASIQARLDMIDAELKAYEDAKKHSLCIQCNTPIGERKHHPFKKGKVCHACFMTVPGKFKDWNEA